MSTDTENIDAMTEALLRGEFFDENGVNEKACDNMAKEIIAGLKSDDPKLKIKASRKKAALRTAVTRIVFGGQNPKTVPRNEIKRSIENPDHITNLSAEQLKSLDGPTRAIRLRCLSCQGNDNVGVRECAAINCVLWPFRMGQNPFFGRLNAEDAEAEGFDTEAEIDALEAQRTGVIDAN